MVNEVRLKMAMANAVRQNLGLDVLMLDQNLRPSAFLATKNLQQIEQETLNEIVYFVWQGGDLPNGRPAPPEAVPGASYWIAYGGVNIFQYGQSPYVEEEGTLTLTPQNVEVAMANHVQDIVDNLVTQKIVQEYLEFLSGQLL